MSPQKTKTKKERKKKERERRERGKTSLKNTTKKHDRNNGLEQGVVFGKA